MERRSSSRIPTEAQRNAATARAFKESKKFWGVVAREYTLREHPAFHGRGKFGRVVKRELRGMYIDSLSSSKEVRAHVEPTPEDSPRETRVKTLYRRRLPEVKRIYQTNLSQASELGPIRRGIIGVETVIFNGSKTESMQVLETIGYSNAEAKFTWGKLAEAGILDGITTAAAWITVGAAVTAEAVSHVISNITDAKVAASYAALYGSTAFVALTNKLLLDNPAIKTCANAIAAAGYYFMPKVTEKWKKTAEWFGAIAGSFAPNLIGEPFNLGLIGKFAGWEGIVARNVASAGIALVTVAGNLAWLAYGKRKERRSQIEK